MLLLLPISLLCLLVAGLYAQDLLRDLLAPELAERVMEVAKPVPAPDTYKYQSRVGSDVG